MNWNKLPDKGGVYFLTEGNECVYIGRSRNIRTRLRGHKYSDFIREGKYIASFWLMSNYASYYFEAQFICAFKPKLNRQLPFQITPKVSPFHISKFDDATEDNVNQEREVFTYESAMDTVKDWMNEHKMRPVDFVRWLELRGVIITQAYLYQMLTQRRPPGPKFKAVFYEITGIRLVDGLVEDK